jgi:hypothetical protein
MQATGEETAVDMKRDVVARLKGIGAAITTSYNPAKGTQYLLGLRLPVVPAQWSLFLVGLGDVGVPLLRTREHLATGLALAAHRRLGEPLTLFPCSLIRRNQSKK